MRFYLLHNHQASSGKITLNSKLSAKQRGPFTFPCRTFLAMPVRQEKWKKYIEGSAEGQRMTLTGHSKLPCSFKVQFAPVIH